MGAIQHEQPHVRRSSSMSFALRWKHEKLRLISISALISIAIVFMFMLLLNWTATKKVTVVVNGKESAILTKQSDLQSLLNEQGISVAEHDRVSAALTDQLKSGDRITIEHTKPVQLTADGETKTVHTVAATVGEALQELQIPVGELDKVTPAVDSELPSGSAIQIVRVKKETEEATEPIAFDVEKKNDPQLLKGKEQVVQEGKEGVLLKTKEKVFEDGQLVAEQVISEKVQSESVKKIVAVGSKNPVVALSSSSPAVKDVSTSGVKFGAKQVINNVTLTAYTAGPESTGKSKSDPGYGVTSTGTKVTEGRTIAVDPKVIPLGWWVYIEGLGFRRAEDTGGAVKGNKIDVYFNSDDYATRFGRKRGYTVYVIGPTKPAVD
ncbi:3D domain-containing protein [Paenibacillus xerothermodurans]|uniref:DUF348 domain-containing protein n=1 Tax=Paenibacillus xerothermodurans TaxID=1977292 RepID=A0A2W1N7Q6_PAEXE|nr:3D domain-containing protein [Paenibacillus xerothermodurans]PZE19191.1 DUF348 domain-containing protein [Paenibacillus xerothermodurans]